MWTSAFCAKHCSRRLLLRLSVRFASVSTLHTSTKYHSVTVTSTVCVTVTHTSIVIIPYHHPSPSRTLSRHTHHHHPTLECSLNVVFVRMDAGEIFHESDGFESLSSSGPSAPPTPVLTPSTCVHGSVTPLSSASEVTDLECSPDGVVSALDEHGVAVLRSVVSPQGCAAARASLNTHRLTANARVQSGDPSTQWFSQRTPYRDDLLLPVDLPGVQGALGGMLLQLCEALANAVGEDAMVIEIAAHVAQVKAAAQSFHTDHDWERERKVISCFLAVQDVTVDMGPTEVFPGSHLQSSHAHLVGEDRCPCDGSTCLGAAAPLLLTLRCGDVALMDGRVVHRGGPRNILPQRPCDRILLYFSVQRGRHDVLR